jgi:UDP-glucose 4-epimerase
VSVKEAIASFEKNAGVSLNYEMGPRRAGDVVSIYSDTTKSSDFLDWKAEKTLDDMVTSAWIWEQNITKETR